MNLPYHPDFSGKVAVVTGGAGILCREFCKALALCGAKVAVLNRTLSKAEAVVGDVVAYCGKDCREHVHCVEYAVLHLKG